MSADFQMAAGTILGSEHSRKNKNNQDASYAIRRTGHTIAIVCDGCSSGAYSEFGAQLGARMIAESLSNQLDRHPWTIEAFPQRALEQARLDALRRMEDMIPSLGYVRGEIIGNFLLFTIVGAVISPLKAIFFTLGDGVIAVNGEVATIGPFPDNTPPYLAYGLTETGMDPELLKFQIQAELPTPQLDNWLIGSDGVSDLIEAAELPMPGKIDPVGDLSQFWSDDRVFLNPDYLRRRLTLINREAVKPDWEKGQLTRCPGLLPDDTTMIVGRKEE